MRKRQRHHQQHAGDAGMHHPGHDRADDDAEHGIAGDGVHEHAHARRIFGRRQRVEQDVQRQQHQPEPDRDAADILDARARPGAEGDQADDEQDGGDGGDFERQDLHDQRGADIGAEHDGKRRHQADQAFRRERARDQRRRGAALEQRRQTEAGRKGGEAVVEPLRQQQAQVRAERAQDSAVDHVQAPQQQRNATHQVEKNHGSHARQLPAARVESSGYRQKAADQPFNLPKIAGVAAAEHVPAGVKGSYRWRDRRGLPNPRACLHKRRVSRAGKQPLHFDYIAIGSARPIPTILL